MGLDVLLRAEVAEAHALGRAPLEGGAGGKEVYDLMVHTAKAKR
jgi:hypothetical protein